MRTLGTTDAPGKAPCHTEDVSRPDLPRRLAELRRCSSAGGRAELSAFSIEGTRLVERALRAGAGLRAVVLGRRFASSADAREARLLDELRGHREVELHVAPDETLREFIGTRSFGDILGLVEAPKELGLTECLSRPQAPFRSGLVCVVDGTDPGNVGALVRTSLAAGAQGFIAVGVTDPFHPKAVRTSMGSIFRLPILRYPSAEKLLARLRVEGVRSLGAVATGGTALDHQRQEPSPLALFLGSEAFGLPEPLVRKMDGCVTIPMRGDVDSLSINAAAAVCLYELLGRSTQEDTPDK